MLAAMRLSAAPEITVEGSDKVDFGKYPAKERKESVFKLVNKGDEVLKIANIRKTCGCAEAKTDKTELKPGETIELKAVILGDSIYGPYSNNVYVETNDPKQKFLSLTTAGEAVPIVAVKPKDTLFIGRIPAGVEWSQKFTLEPTQDGVELGEPAVKSAHKLECSLKKVGGSWELSVRFTPENIGEFSVDIKLPVAKPEGWKPVTIKLAGRIGQALQAVPALVKLPASGGGQVTREIRLKLLGGDISKLKPESILWTKRPGLEIRIGKADNDEMPITLVFSEEFFRQTANKLFFKLELRSPPAEPAAITIEASD